MAPALLRAVSSVLLHWPGAFCRIFSKATHRLTDLAKFKQVQSPFARFVLADERLRLAQHCGQIALTQTRPQANLSEEGLQLLLCRGEEALFHDSD